MENNKKPELERELEREIMDIKKELETNIETQNYDAIDEFLDNAIDLIFHIGANTKQIIGFDIGITTGGPNITLEYTRGRCELVGAWGGARLTMDVNGAVCEEIMERLDELNNGN
jgi:hypothetical protein